MTDVRQGGGGESCRLSSLWSWRVERIGESVGRGSVPQSFEFRIHIYEGMRIGHLDEDPDMIFMALVSDRGQLGVPDRLKHNHVSLFQTAMLDPV